LPGGRLRSDSILDRSDNDYVAFAPFAQTFAIAAESAVELWDASSCREIGFLTGFGRLNGPLAFSADGRLLFAVSRDQRAVHVWDVALRKELFTLPLPRERSMLAKDWLLAVSPDGLKVAYSITDAAGNTGIYLFSGLPAHQSGSQLPGGTANGGL
jgi:WD40 repeat protein